MALDTGLDGKVALVTGAASGIGQAVSVALAREGAHLVVADRQSCCETMALLSAVSNNGFAIDVDVSDRDQVMNMVERTVDARGRLDLYVNNAASALHQAIVELQPATWYANLETNLAACAWACSAVGASVVSQRSGAILIVGSTSTFTPRATEAAYRVSKTGLNALMEVLAIELAPVGVRVNMLTPGSFLTGLTRDMTDSNRLALEVEIPLSRSAEPDELAATALLLLSDRLSPYTTGANFVVDGGIHLRPIRL